MAEVVVDGIIYQEQSHGGISRLYEEILPRICEMDSTLCVTLMTDGKLKRPLPKHPHITHLALPPVSFYMRPRRIWGPVIPPVRRFVQQLKVGRGHKSSIWHSTYYTMPGEWRGKQIVTVHDMIHERFKELYPEPLNDWFRREKQRCLQRADMVICVSESTRHDVQRFYGIDSARICVIYHGCSSVFRRLTRDDVDTRWTERPYLLYVGDRGPHKNFDSVVRAYSVWPLRKHVSLVVVGRPWSPREKALLVELAIRENVLLLTHVDDSTLCQLYNCAAAFVYPSFYEGFGIPLLEAMACGCPIIASRIPSTVEVAEDCPIYFELTGVNSMLSAFDLALSEGRESERVYAGLERVKNYSWEKSARQILETYYALLSGAG